MKKVFVLLAAFLHLGALSLNAFDFGLVFNQNADLNAPTSDFEKAGFKISGVLLPRFSELFGENGDLYISAAINYQAVFGSGARPFAIIPELTRTDFAFNLGHADIRIGRMFYSDPLGLVANNLFDGARASFITRNGNFHAGAWYTGLLYRERAAIAMTPDELKSSGAEVDYSDFGNTYFAPSRILAALEYDHPSLAGFISLKTSIMAQFDAGDDKLNSQYLTAALSFPVKSFIFDLGGCFELIQYNDETKPAFAADIGLTFILPTKLEKHITLSWRYSSGVSEDNTIGAFLPITTVKQGEILEAKLSALSLLSLGFTGRLAQSLSANFAFTYFIRNDLGTYTAYPVVGVNSEGFFLGTEIFGRFIWNITTGTRLNFGTGLFIPELGDAAPDAGMMWRTNVNLIISIF
ncbi:MAG: hypothetical protein LBC52_04955 [Treponema sp.]|jgi:hypothetical protein|nr:hypothetical protein [Treponema sp.]